MRRPLVRSRFTVWLRRSAAGQRAQRGELATQARQFLGVLQHRPVLFGDVPLEVGDLFLQPLHRFVQGFTFGFAAAAALNACSSGTTMRV